MSTNNTNNSGNVSSGTIFIGGGGGGGGGTAASSGSWTFTIGPGGFIGYTPEVEPVKETKKKDNRDGCDCKKCKEFYPYSEPNQDDGTLICYACRHGY